LRTNKAPVAQLDRALPSEAGEFIATADLLPFESRVAGVNKRPFASSATLAARSKQQPLSVVDQEQQFTSTLTISAKWQWQTFDLLLSWIYDSVSV